MRRASFLGAPLVHPPAARFVALVVVGSPRRRLAPRGVRASRARGWLPALGNLTPISLPSRTGRGATPGVARQEDTDITLVPVSEASPARTRRAPASGCWLHVGICARRRSRRQRGGAGRIRFASVELRRDVLRLPGGGLRPHVQRRQHTNAIRTPGLAAGYENPRLKVPMDAVSRHLPPRPKADPQAPGMFAFADPQRVFQVLTAAGWAPPRLDKPDLDLDIAAGRGLEEAVVQATQIDAVNS